MSESPNDGNTPAKPPKKRELTSEMRMLIAFILMGGVMLVSQLWFKPKEAPPVPRAEQSAPVPKAGEPPLPAATSPPPTTAEIEPPKPVAEATPAKVEPAVIIDTDVFRVVFNNQGATVRSWQLKKYKDNENKPLDLVNTASTFPFPFSLHFPDKKPGKDVNWEWFKQTPDADGLGVTYEYSDGHTVIVKSFRFEKASYLSRVSTTVATDGQPVPHMIAWRGGFGDMSVETASANQRTLHYDLAQNSLVQQTPSGIKDGSVSARGNFSFSGIADNYFAAVFLPENPTEVQVTTFPDWVRTPTVEKPAGFAGVAVSASPANKFELFVGPKDLDLLARINPKLVEVIDFGWLKLLAKPLFQAVNWINDRAIHNYGWSIVLITIVINFVLFPLKFASLKSAKKMQALKPQMDQINERYKGLKMTDPRSGEKNQEVMALYKKHGVNPAGGCVPMLLQIPFFFAFYKVFTVAVEMRGATWLWVKDLSQPEVIAMLPGIKILPILMIASQFWMQKMTPQPNQDPAQARMMLMMPLVFGFMFYNFPSGLVLYYLTSNLVSMGQQLMFNRTGTAQQAALSVEAPKKKNGRK